MSYEEPTSLSEAPKTLEHQTHYHHKPRGFSDRLAYGLVHFAARTADIFFVKRYGHRAVVLETVAAIPGMVGGTFQHLKALRRFRDDNGWIRTLLDEAENERMHLMVYICVAKPTTIERLFIIVVQVIIYNVFFLMYFLSPRTAHRFVGYLEEEAVHSYTAYLDQLRAEPEKNIPAPEIAIKYWNLDNDARMIEVVEATRKDEMHHRDVNHDFANRILHNHL